MIIKNKFRLEEVQKLTNRSFLIKVFNTVLSRHYEGFKKIIKLEKEIYKKHFRSTRRFHYVISCQIKAQIGTQEVSKTFVIGSSSDDSKRIAYFNLRMLREHGFDRDDLQVTKPIAYLPELKAVVYKAAPGQTLFSYFKERPTFEQLLNPLEISARWLQKLHSLDPASLNSPLANSYSFQSILDYLRRYLSKFKKASATDGQKLESVLIRLADYEAAFRKSSSPRIIFGDYHPENIILDSLDSKKLIMIDLTDLSLGDRYRDVGTFIQQFDFMSQSFLPRSQINDLKKHFVKSYFHKEFHDLKDVDIRRINLYQALTAVRSSVWLFDLSNSRKASLELLEDANLLLQKVEKKDISINLR